MPVALVRSTCWKIIRKERLLLRLARLFPVKLFNIALVNNDPDIENMK